MVDLLESLIKNEGSPEGAASFSSATDRPASGADDQPAAGSPENAGADMPRIVAELPTDADRREAVEEQGRFEWGPGGQDIVVLGQRAIAVYRNAFGSVVLREESPDGDYDDAFIVLRDADAVRALIAALKRELGGG